MESLDALVVGAGFAGAVCARRMAEDYGLRVLVIDRRPHVAGNAHDALDAHGVLIHTYGPHIFHTNAGKVTDFLSRFTDWLPYEHRVWAEVDGQIIPLPVNRTTIERLHRVELADEDQTAAYLASLAEPRAELKNSEDAVVAKVGRDLYERLFRGYTRKQWALDPAELHASVCGRIPVRFNQDDRYFADSFQKMPAAGFTAMFERMLDHPNIELRLGTEYEHIRNEVQARHTVWTGPIDEFFGYRLGKLPYRSLHFVRETRATPTGRLVQPVAVINYPNERVPFTRVTEFRHLTGQVSDFSTLTYEYPTADGDPYYPIPRPENRELYHRYETLATRERPDVLFVGRLARYQYLNMDQVTAAALVAVERWAAERDLRPALPEAA
ncbi:MAG TPA: UDP-galactopyranose mutase [Solirubrobacteraceae bacterium]|nr:UDP-galactopyranose mutase [Solirubrobacteraceae bacterium]